jgi:hypothetical protein
MTRQEVSSRESQSTLSSRGWWFWTVYLAIFAGAALIGWLGLIGATSSASRPPVSYTEEGFGPSIVVGLLVAGLVAAAVWLAVRTVTGRTPSKATTVVLLAASALLIQAAMAGVWELGRRQGEADVRAQVEVSASAQAEADTSSCSGSDIDLLGDVYSALGSRWGPFAASGRTNGSCHGPKMESNERADRDSDWVVALMADDGWTLAESKPFLVFERGTDQIHMMIDYFRVTPEEGSHLVVVDFWVQP